MKRFAIPAGLMSLALVIGVAGTSFHPGKAQAKPSHVISFNPNVCSFWLGGESACYSLTSPAALAQVAADLKGNVDAPDTYKDLVDASAAQLGSASTTPITPNSQSMWVLSFVTNDDNVSEDADEGVWLSTGGTASAQGICPFADADCDQNAATVGDGVVVDLLYSGGNTLDLGDAQVVVTQSGMDVATDYAVVGQPDNLAFWATKRTIQEASGAACDLSDANSQVGLPDVAGLLAIVTDGDGTSLTGISVDWTSTNMEAVVLATAKSVSIGGSFAAQNLGCGGNVGSSRIHAFVSGNEGIDFEVAINVVGAPAVMTVSATPAAMVCDGVNGSTVTATLTDSNGNPVADGTPVHFAVQGPAVVNPITASTVGGVASTVVTGLSGVATMLPVSVTSGSLEASIGVICIAPPPPALTGDVNCDGKVSMVDAMLVAQYAVGLRDGFTCAAPATPIPTP